MASPLRVAFVSNAPPSSGVGKPAVEWLTRLRAFPELAVDHFEIDERAHVLRKNGAVFRRFFRAGGSEPKPLFWWRAARSFPAEGYDLWHCTNQTLAFLPRRPKLVTVFDLIELRDPQTPLGRPLARFLYRGLGTADGLTAVSRFTAREVERVFGRRASDLVLTPLAAGPQYRPLPRVREDPAYRALASRCGLDDAAPVVLFVGSEHPRKNLATVVRAIAEARRRLPALRFVKVGPAGIAAGRRSFLGALRTHGLTDATIRIEQGDETTLPLLYNRASVLLFPSLLEGFGLPPLEAMQCGCPVVVSNRASLPEVTGDAGITVDPFDVGALARAITRVVTDGRSAAALRARGLLQARRFSWERSAEALREAYRTLYAPEGRTAGPSPRSASSFGEKRSVTPAMRFALGLTTA